jgi:exonuclease III
MSRDISPPPSKRRKTSPKSSTTTSFPASLPPPPPSPSTLRIYSWNINGISPFLQMPITSFFPTPKPVPTQTPPASLRGFLHRHHYPAILFLQEVKISLTDLRTQDAVRKAVNARLPSETPTKDAATVPEYDAHFTLPNDPHNARGPRGSGKVYGVCSIIRRDLFSNSSSGNGYKANVRPVHWDNEGRVSVVEITCPPSLMSKKLAIFNIYAVNGTDNPYRDPATGAVLGTRHDRKLAFHRLLMEECVRLEKEGWRVVVAGDVNVAPAVIDGHPKLRIFPRQHVLNRGDFKARFLGGECEQKGGEVKEETFDGVDVWRELNAEERRYTYYPRSREWGSSCDRVDYAIVGRKVWDEGMVVDAGILDSAAERGPSDHVPIWVDIRLEEGEGQE